LGANEDVGGAVDEDDEAKVNPVDVPFAPSLALGAKEKVELVPLPPGGEPNMAACAASFGSLSAFGVAATDGVVAFVETDKACAAWAEVVLSDVSFADGAGAPNAGLGAEAKEKFVFCVANDGGGEPNEKVGLACADAPVVEADCIGAPLSDGTSSSALLSTSSLSPSSLRPLSAPLRPLVSVSLPSSVYESDAVTLSLSLSL